MINNHNDESTVVIVSQESYCIKQRTFERVAEVRGPLLSPLLVDTSSQRGNTFPQWGWIHWWLFTAIIECLSFGYHSYHTEGKASTGHGNRLMENRWRSQLLQYPFNALRKWTFPENILKLSISRKHVSWYFNMWLKCTKMGFITNVQMCCKLW